MSAGELGYDRESLDQITKGLNATIDELAGFGSRTGSVMGSGVEELTLSKMEAGDGGLADDFEDFCDRWEWGVRALVQNANGLADRLNLSAGRVFEADQYEAETWKVGFNSLMGNPYATEEEITDPKMGYADIVGQNLRPDLSAEEGSARIAQDWKDTAHEAVTEGQGGFVTGLHAEAAGLHERQVDQAADDFFGPTAEGRAQQQDRRSGGGEG